MDDSIHPVASSAPLRPELVRWHDVALPVSDLARSIGWYRRVLFATVQRTTDSAAELAAGRIPQAWLDIAGITVNLAQHHPLAADPERHFLHIALGGEIGSPVKTYEWEG